MKATDIYRPARRSYRGLPEIEYPLHDRGALVTACGRICMHRKSNISTVMDGQRLGLKEVPPRHLHGLRPRIQRLRTEDPATYRQPVRHTDGYPCLATRGMVRVRYGAAQIATRGGLRTKLEPSCPMDCSS